MTAEELEAYLQSEACSDLLPTEFQVFDPIDRHVTIAKLCQLGFTVVDDGHSITVAGRRVSRAIDIPKEVTP